MIGFTFGVIVGAAVTAMSIDLDDWWAQRLGRTRWRRANLPVGGMLLAVIAGASGASVWVWGPMAAGLALAAVGWRWVQPLPPMM